MLTSHPAFLQAVEVCNEVLGVSPTASKLTLYDQETWEEFCVHNHFQQTAEGLYVPKTKTAYVRTDTILLITNIFHEYFGHGTFCEHSTLGKRLVTAAQETLDTTSILYEHRDPDEEPLGITRKNIWNYEGFALWFEALLAERTGNESIVSVRLNQ